MKLHLGCGQVYLDGYINIDYPLDKHTVQHKSVADKFHDLTKLRYKAGSIDEVRLHHVYEHFPRNQAIALLAAWNTWLKRGGKVHIEVPDFDESAKLALNPKTSDHDRKVALRHIFGSNEAPWATHYEGWSKERLIEVLRLFGFKNIKVEQTAYMATRNVIVTANRGFIPLSASRARAAAKKYLSGFNVNNSKVETDLLQVWLKEFDHQYKLSAAKK